MGGRGSFFTGLHNRRAEFSGSVSRKQDGRHSVLWNYLRSLFMPGRKLSPEALALLYLRAERRWSKRQLASALGFSDEKQLSRYESGDKPLRRENLDSMAAGLGHSSEAVDALLFVHSLISPDEPPASLSPVALTARERQRIARTAITAGWTV